MPDLVTRAVQDLFISEHDGLWDHAYVPVAGEPNGPRYLLDILWADTPSERLANIAFNCSGLLSLDEKRLWQRVLADAKYWLHPKQRTNNQLRLDVLEEDWVNLQA